MQANIPSNLVAAGNINNPCLLVLRDKGYDLWLEPLEEGSLWCASKESQQVAVYSGPELLGLVTLWEHLGTGWNQQTPNLYEELLDGAVD